MMDFSQASNFDCSHERTHLPTSLVQASSCRSNSAHVTKTFFVPCVNEQLGLETSLMDKVLRHFTQIRAPIVQLQTASALSLLNARASTFGTKAQLPVAIANCSYTESVGIFGEQDAKDQHQTKSCGVVQRRVFISFSIKTQEL